MSLRTCASPPVWLPDPDFDIGQLIRYATLPGRGGDPSFGLNADRDTLPDLKAVRDGIEQSLHALARVAA